MDHSYIHARLRREDQASDSLEASSIWSMAESCHWVERPSPPAPRSYRRPVQRAPVGPHVLEQKCSGRSHPLVCRFLFRSLEWQETHDPRKSQLYENKEDGEFWYLVSF